MTGRFISDALLKKLALGTKIAKIFYSLAFIVIGDTGQRRDILLLQIGGS